MESNIAALKKDNEAKEQTILSLTREKVFSSAGLDIADKRTQYFIKGYEGELDAEAVRMEAEAAGFLSQERNISSDHQQMHDFGAEERMAAAGEGGDPYTPTDLDQQMLKAKSQEELKAIWENAGHLWGAAT